MTEQAREVRDLEQAEAWAEAVVTQAVVDNKGVEEVSRPARADIAFARTAVKDQPIGWEALVTNRNAPSVERQ